MDTIDSLFQQIVRDNAERPAVIEFNRTLTSRELSELVGRIVGLSLIHI